MAVATTFTALAAGPAAAAFTAFATFTSALLGAFWCDDLSCCVQLCCLIGTGRLSRIASRFTTAVIASLTAFLALTTAFARLTTL